MVDADLAPRWEPLPAGNDADATVDTVLREGDAIQAPAARPGLAPVERTPSWASAAGRIDATPWTVGGTAERHAFPEGSDPADRPAAGPGMANGSPHDAPLAGWPGTVPPEVDSHRPLAGPPRPAPEAPSRWTPHLTGQGLDAPGPAGPAPASRAEAASSVATTARTGSAQAAPPPAEQIVHAARLLVERGETRITIELDPAELGPVSIALTSTADGVALVLTAERADTRALLLHSLPELQGALAGQGVATASLAVSPPSPPPARPARQERREPGRRPPEQDGPRQAPRDPGGRARVGAVNFTV